MKKTALPLWGTVLIIAFCPLTVDSSPSWCRKFSYYANQDSASYQCDPQCLVSSFTDEGDVFGNEHYSQDSEICLAAKHAGVDYDSTHRWVYFAQDPEGGSEFSAVGGSVRNGVVSKFGNATSTFQFTLGVSGFDVQSCPNGRICDRNSWCVHQDKICDFTEKCNSRKKMCNGVQDCSDNTDEMECEGVAAPWTPALSLEESLPHELRVFWTIPADSPPADKFDVSYQFIKNVACASIQLGEVRTVSTTSNSFIAKELDSYSQYKICVASVNKEGRSKADCKIYDTGNDVPQVTLDQQQCTSDSSGSTKCQSRVDDCRKINGRGFAVKVELNTFLECEGTNKPSVLEAKDFDHLNVISASTDHLIPGQDYEATMTPVNEAGEGTPVTTSFTTKDSKPPKATDMTAEAHSSSEVRLKFREECPTNGRITSSVVKHRIGDSQWEGVSPAECPTTDTSEKCLAVSNLIPGTTYTFAVALRNSAGVGTYSQVTVTTKDAEPGSPTLINLTRKDNSVIVHLSLPLLTGRKPENCSIELSKDIILSDVPSSGNTLDIEINNLERGRRYAGKVICCSMIECGGSLDIRVSTRPSKATFTSKIAIISTTDSSITVNLPKMKVEGDEKGSIAVLVKHIESGNEVTNFTEEFIRLRDTTGERMKRSSMPLHRREKRQSTCKAINETYIAGIVDENGGEFVVGMGTRPNCRLLPEENYRIAAVGEVSFDGESNFTEDDIRRFATVETESGSAAAIVVPIVIIILIIILGFGAFVVWKKCRR